MNVLVACEFTGAVRDAFRRLGHEAWSCDLPDVEPEGDYAINHLVGDCREFIDHPPFGTWDLLIAHPPCTYLCNSGVRWLFGGHGHDINWDRCRPMLEAVAFFKYLLNAPIPKVAVENPIMHRYAKERVGPQTQVIQPWQFGHGETKATCLWLRNLPWLWPTKIVEGRHPAIHLATPSDTRSQDRSRTYPGIAEAMAKQWGMT